MMYPAVRLHPAMEIIDTLPLALAIQQSHPKWAMETQWWPMTLGELCSYGIIWLWWNTKVIGNENGKIIFLCLVFQHSHRKWPSDGLSSVANNSDCWVSISGSGSAASFFAEPKNRNGTATLEPWHLGTWCLQSWLNVMAMFHKIPI